MKKVEKEHLTKIVDSLQMAADYLTIAQARAGLLTHPFDVPNGLPNSLLIEDAQRYTTRALYAYGRKLKDLPDAKSAKSAKSRK